MLPQLKRLLRRSPGLILGAIFLHGCFLLSCILLSSIFLSYSVARSRPTTVAAAEVNWPAWRGTAGVGVAGNVGLPLEWSKDRNVLWKTPLPGPGNSTPIVWGQRVFLTAALDDGAKRMLLAYDRETGKLLWQREVTAPAKEPTHETNPYAAASPVTDGERVIVWHGSAGVYAYDLQGQPLWNADLGQFKHIWGYAASPVIEGELVILSCGPGVRCLLVALDKRTGRQVWKRDLPEAQSKDEKEYVGSWSTPVVATTGGKRQLLLSLPHELRSFDPANGHDLWRCKGLGPLAYTSPLVSGGIAVAMSGFHGAALACKTNGSGDVTQTHRLWHHTEKNPQRIGSGVIVDGNLYLLNEPGIMVCLELTTGKKRWEQRVGPSSWSSLVHIDGRLIVLNMQAETLVLAPDPTAYKLLAKNPLDNEITRASHAFAPGQAFIRTYKHLYCIGQKVAQ